ncbi:MAG: helix-turn-helix domain-containing protein [Acetobacteraceae bacterium]
MLAMQCWVLRLVRSVVCHARHALEARIARWLLMLRDELGLDDLLGTHEFLAEALGVRRAGVTGAMLMFQQDELLKQGSAGVCTSPTQPDPNVRPVRATLNFAGSRR